MLIDTHQHVFWHGRDDAGLVADLDAHGIDVAWLLSWEIAPEEDAKAYHGVLNPIHNRPDGTHAGIPLSDLLIAQRNYPGRFIVGYCPHPLKPSAPELFEAAYKICGVRVCGEWKFRVLFDDPRCINLFRTAGRLNCPVVLHLDFPFMPDAEGKITYQREWYGGTVANLERALQACPQTTFIGHAPGFWSEISADSDKRHEMYPTGPVTPGGRVYRLFETYPNLMADMSAGSGRNALARDPAHARSFIEKFSDRLLFGRDFYGSELHDFLKTLDLPQNVWNKITFENAIRLVPVGEKKGN